MKNHPKKTVDIFEHEDSNRRPLWILKVKRGDKTLERFGPVPSLWAAVKHALGNHCGFDDEPKEPTIHALDPSDTVTLLS
jgi:hypothetical protein|tara:strand:- start:43 stop:282 length:240 start_codon:yes stop_codon:yes gene_type:complete